MKEDLEVLDKFLEEGREYILKRDPVQASEKLYKAVEESLKLLAEEYKLLEHEEFRKEGRWWTRLLAGTASTLARKLGERKIEEAWTIAFNLHVWGFHERALGVEHIEPDVPYVEWLVNYTKEVLEDKAK